MDVVAAMIGRATWRFLKFCNECWRDTEKDDFDNEDYLNDSSNDSGDSESKSGRKKKTVASNKKRRTNIKMRRMASSEINNEPVELNNEPVDVLKWAYTSVENAVDHIDDAVVGGYDIEGNDLWIIRARFMNQVVPGMLNLCKKKAVAAAKKEDRNFVKSVDNFEVLCINSEARNRIMWTKCSNGEVPKNAVEAGRNFAGDTLYVGREIHEEEGHPGKDIQYPGMVQPKHGVLYVTYDDEVFAHKLYEVLCID